MNATVIRSRLLVAIVATWAAIAASGCAAVAEPAAPELGSVAPESTAPETAAVDDTPAIDAAAPASAPETAAPDLDEAMGFGGVDPDARRGDGLCVGADDAEVDYIVAHQVVGTDLGAVCLGEQDQALVDVWWLLTELVPKGQLQDLGLFAGFVEPAEQVAPTLAFVESIDDSQFELSVNLDHLGDHDELAFTLLHEFSHVFTATPIELDRYLEAEECDTYHSGEGCHVEGALMVRWVERFWPGVVDQESFDPSIDAALDRCDADAGFLGSYAATSPEEDFAESFAAWALSIEPASEAQAERLAWFEQFPGLADFRARAEILGHSPIPNEFELCGEG